MKIALFRFDLDANDGGARQLFWMAREFKRLGHDVKIFTQNFDRNNCYPEVSSQFSVYCLHSGPRARHIPIISALYRVISILRIVGMMMSHDFDIINPHEVLANWPAAVHKLLKRTPVVWTCNDAWFYLPEDLRRMKPEGGCLRRRILKPIIRLVDRLLTRTIDLIVVLDRRMKNLVDSIYGCDSRIIHPGIDHRYLDSMIDPGSREAVFRRHGISGDPFVALSASIIHPYRRFEDSIRATRALLDAGVNLHLIIVGFPGDQDYVSFLREIVSSLRLEQNVHFDLRFVSDRELAQYYQACDCYIFANNEQTWGMGAIEAAAYSRPCVISKGSGVHEIFTDSVDAFLVSPCSPDQIALAVRRLIEDPPLRDRMASSARKLVGDTISWEIQAEQMLAAFRSVSFS